MNKRPPSRCTKASPTAALREVDRLAERRGWGRPPFLIRMLPTRLPGQFELSIREFEDIGRHPLDALLGFQAPRRWSGLGIVAEGWMAPMDEPVRPSQSTKRQRVRSIMLATRAGAAASGYRTKGKPLVVAGEAPIGRVPAALRRALGLPSGCTPPDLRLTAAAMWLSSLLAPEEPMDDAAAFAELLSDPSLSWAVLRECAAGGAYDDFSPDLATWMDTEMFGEWFAASWPPIEEILMAIRAARPEALGKAEEFLARASILKDSATHLSIGH